MFLLKYINVAGPTYAKHAIARRRDGATQMLAAANSDPFSRLQNFLRVDE